MIKEVLVVEGKMDVVAINKAVEADCIITEGFNLLPKTIKNIRAAYEKRGIIILTDPDSAGERIRTYFKQEDFLMQSTLLYLVKKLLQMMI